MSRPLSPLTLHNPLSGIVGRGEGGIVVGTENLLLWTEEFDNVVWLKSGATVTANAALAPDGGMTADQIDLSTGGSISQISTVSATAGPNVVLSSTISGTWSRVEKSGTYDGSPYTASIWLKTSGGNQDVSLLLRRSGGFIRFDLIDFDDLGPLTIYAWGSQLEVGSSATDYTSRTI
jgi:hypothetical protein